MNKRNTNKRLTIKNRVNKFAPGGTMEMLKKSFNNGNLGSSVGTLIGGVGNIAQTAISNAQIKDTAAEESSIRDTGNTAFSTGSYDNLQESFNPLALQRTNYSSKDVRGLNGWQMAGNTLTGMGSGFTTGASIGGIWGGVAGALGALGANVGGIIAGDNKATAKAAALNADAIQANKNYLNNYAFSVTNTGNANFKRKMLDFAYGGPMFNLTGDFNNGLTFINEGGTHEENPIGGVPMGIDEEGTPNLVEEGEVIYNDYVFSNRLKPTKKQLADGGFKDKYEGYTFAKLVEDISKPYADTPNDPITKAGLEDMMNRIMTMQEEIRAKKGEVNTNKFDTGGSKQKSYYDTIVNNFINQALKPVEFTNDPPMFIRYNEVLPEVKSIIDNNSTIKNSGKPVNANLTSVFEEPVIDRGNFNWGSLGRYAPVLTNTSMLLNNLRNPDYSNIDRIDKVAQNMPGGTFTALGDYIDLNPIDRNYTLNPLMATSRSTARAIQNQGLSAGQTQAGLLANAYNTYNGIGSALMQIEQENMNRRLQEGQFDRGTNQANSQMGLQALAMDQQKYNTLLNTSLNTSQLREALAQTRAQSISNAASAISEDLSGIGQEAVYKEWLGDLIASGALKYKKAKCGGMLTKKGK